MSGEPHPDDPATLFATPAAQRPPSPASPETETQPNATPRPPLTPEEQMEQFAKELKENDWGHQPC